MCINQPSNIHLAEERKNDEAIEDINRYEAEERREIVDEILENIRDDVIGVSQEIEMIEPVIEKDIFFEDLLQKDRLNDDVDLEDDARIRTILDTISKLDEKKYQKKIDRSYIREIRNSKLNLRMHLDGGANRSVTDDLRLLHDVRNISNYAMHGAQKGEPTISCSKVGYIKLICRGRGVINVRTYYSPDVSETILSPGDITKSNDNNFCVWEQQSDISNGKGFIRFSSKSGLECATVDTYLMNGLWYATQLLLDCIQPKYKDWNETPESTSPILRRLSKAALHELWHQRLCHPGETVTSTVSRTAEGVPVLTHGRNAFYKCDACMRAKVQRTAKPHNNTTKDSPVYGAGQMFHMDFGFVRGTDFKTKNEEGRIVTSRDGYNSYLIIVDRHSSYTWVMLSKNKDPPVEFVQDFLATHKDKNCPVIRIRTDQGGELWASSEFKKTIRESTCVLEPTGSGDPAQNGKAESPNKMFGRMLRGMLFNAGLGSEFWSYALLHAVYVKNRLPHSALHMKQSPYEAYTGVKPNLSLLRVWGCRVIVKRPEHRKAKLDDNTARGIFLRYTATDKNIVYLDIDTNIEKISSNVIFDEAHFSTGSLTPGSKALKSAGSMHEKDSKSNSELENDTVKIKRIHKNAKLPVRSHKSAAGMDLFTPESFSIQGHSRKMISVGIAMSLPKGIYGRVAPKSGLTVNKNIDVKAGVIDRDFRGELTVVMHNMGSDTQEFSAGDKIAQLILERCSEMEVKEWSMKLEETDRGMNGFGSTDPVVRQIHSPNINGDNIILSTSPYGPTMTVECKLKGNHCTLGLELDEESMAGRVTLLNCTKGTPSARIPRWRSQLRGAILRSINSVAIKTIDDVVHTVERFKKETASQKPAERKIEIQFSMLEKVSIHSEKGVPQMYYDQLNVIAKHHLELKEKAQMILEYKTASDEHDEDWESTIRMMSNESSDKNIVKQKNAKVVEKLTRKLLMERDDWDDWRKSEAKQLDQYQQQGMFGNPEPRPTKANILSLLWTYLVKADGTKKARCCCNGNPGRQGSITLAHTYAACVEQPAQRVYWGLVAIKNYIAIGADASNAFAEAPPPKAPLYVLVDRPYREWYKQKTGKYVPKGYVLRVHHAIQGHPEAPRLWSVFIDEIIRNKLGFIPMTHEKCLYRGKFKGKEVMFLRQVDDFSVAAEDEMICNDVINEVSRYLTAPLKNLGKVTRFNGVEIDQTKYFVKIHNLQYIEKILTRHGWLNDTYKPPKSPVPMRSDSKYLFELENSKGPDSDKERLELEVKMKFNYRQALGEILYAMITCRPDISISVTKLSQYSQNPAEIHYVALKNIFRYLRSTRRDGLVFWRKSTFIHQHIENIQLPTMYSDMIIQKEIEQDAKMRNEDMIAYVDSDWAGDTSHRKSITGIAVVFAGAVIAYKSRIQKTIALSSTEAEFMAACDAGKTVLYLRTILEEMGVEQNEATLLFEDNQGALMMANAQQPTRRTRHLDTAAFALQDWVSRDLLNVTYIASHKNSSDGMTKPLSRILFYKHFDVLMGRLVPERFKIYRIMVSEAKENETTEGNTDLRGSDDTTMNTKDSHAKNLHNI